MKKAVITTLVLFWIGIGAFIVNGFMNPGNSPSAPVGTTIHSPLSTLPPTTTVKLDLTELAKHSSSTDCWLLIDGYFYDVTSYLYAHPGGGTIVPSCGQEASQMFVSKGGRGAHSQNAWNELAAYRVGQLGSDAPTAAIDQVKKVAPPTYGGAYEDD